MSLFGAYIEGSDWPEVKADVVEEAAKQEEVVKEERQINISESFNVLAFMSGNLIAEAQNFGTLVMMEDSIYPDVYNEAVNGKLEVIMKKFKDFIDKAIQFFQDLAQRIQISVLTKLAQITSKEFKKDCTYLDLVKVEASEEYKKAEKTVSEMLKAKDAFKKIDDDTLSDIRKVNWAQLYARKDFQVTKKAGQPCDFVVKKYIEYGKSFSKRNAETIKDLRALKASYTNEKSPEAVQAVVKVVNAAMDMYRIENAQMVSNAAKIIKATIGPGPKKEEEKKDENAA